MGKLLLLLIIIFSFSLSSQGQVHKEKVVFVIDSVPLTNTPEKWNLISTKDVADINYVSDQAKLKQLGWEKADTVIYITTKEYLTRPDSIKRIPSLRQMIKQEDIWTIKDIAYNGKYIDYYNNGRKLSEGTLVYGRLDGKIIHYSQDGTIKTVTDYKNGLVHGWLLEYHRNGNLAGKTQYIDGKMKGLYETYFYTGPIKVRGNIKGDYQKDTTFVYYSTGKVKDIIISINRIPVHTRKQEEIGYLSNKYDQNLKSGRIEAAYKTALELVETDSTLADGYLKKGFTLLRKYFFDKAIGEFDRAIEIEPLLGEAYVYRALARIKKHQFGSSGLLTKYKKEALLDSWKLESLPTEDRDKICHDLQQAINLGVEDGTVNKFINEATAYYCQKGCSR